MNYDKLPELYKKIISKSELFSNTNEDRRIELDDSSYYVVEDYLVNQFGDVIDSLNLEGPDDTALSAYLEIDAYPRSKKVDVTIRGSFRFCVYGCELYSSEKRNKLLQRYPKDASSDKDFTRFVNNQCIKYAFSKIYDAMSNHKFKGFTIDNLYQPEDTYGISFDAIQQDSDTIYIGGEYDFPLYSVDVELSKNQKYIVAVKPFDFDGLPVEITLTAPRGSSEEQLKEIIVNEFEDALLSDTKFESFDFTDYSAEGTGYFECKVRITFNNIPYTIYLDNETSPKLRLNNETSARILAWEQLLEDLEVEDVTRFS